MLSMPNARKSRLAAAPTTERRLRQQSGGSNKRKTAQNADEPALWMNQSTDSRSILKVALDVDRILFLLLGLRRRLLRLLLGGDEA